MEARHLRGIQRRSAAASASRDVSHEGSRQALLVCGIASSLLYAAMIWAIRYEGYSPISQVPSELTAIGAPTQALWARLGWIYTMLVTADRAVGAHQHQRVPAVDRRASDRAIAHSERAPTRVKDRTMNDVKIARITGIANRSRLRSPGSSWRQLHGRRSTAACCRVGLDGSPSLAPWRAPPRCLRCTQARSTTRALQRGGWGPRSWRPFRR
jgi:hypothetical protein